MRQLSESSVFVIMSDTDTKAAQPGSQSPRLSGRHVGKTAVVTGASRGIGLAIAERLVTEGARVLITARNADALAQAASRLGDDRAVWVAGAADDHEHQQAAIDKALSDFGRLDYLVNNTGINPAYGRLVDLEPAAAHKILAVNVVAALRWTQLVYRAWMGRHGGAVVNVASIAGLRPTPDLGMYGASKAALIHLTEELALELGPRVRVNAVAPAVVKTKFATALYEGREEDVAKTYPLKRLGVPDDVAGAVSFLLSEDAAWITGHTLAIDGGMLTRGGA